MKIITKCISVILLVAVTPGVSAKIPGAVSQVKMVFIKGNKFTPAFFITKKPVSYNVKSFYMDDSLVTKEQYLNFVKTKPEWKKSQIPDIYHDGKYLSNWKSDFNYGDGKAKQPVTEVSWFAARAYCNWQNKRLPTELEWEYTASEKNQESLSWYWQPQVSQIPEIRQGKPNKQGIYDFHNLVWEWLGDFNNIIINSDSRASGNKQEIPAFCGSTGNFTDKRDYAAFVRYSLRSTLEASYTMNNLGFRCARDAR